MNLKKKLTSALSLVLVLSMLLSSAVMATDLADAEAGSASSSSSEPAEPTEPVANDPAASTEEPTEPTEPTEPSSPEEPTNDPTADPAPDAMTSAKGWVADENDQWIYTYTDLNGNEVLAGDPKTYPTGKVQVLYVPEQKCAIGDTTVTRTAGFYAFSNGVWLKDYTTVKDGKDNPVLFKSVTEVEIRQDGNAYQLESKDCKYTGERLLSFQVADGESKGTLFTGRWVNPKNNVKYRYENGLLYTGYGLGTEKTPNLYYYYKGLYQKVTVTVKKKTVMVYDGKKSLSKMKSNNGYHLFEGKLYYASETTLSKKKTSPYASLFTGRWTNEEDGVKRRYEKGVPYNGFGLGTEKTPNLYYYVDGLYQKTKDKHGKVIYNGHKSKEELEAFLGDGKTWTDKKLYVATEATLVGTKTQPYATPLTGYRMVNGKMYKYTKGTGVLFTGVYNGTESSLKKYKGYYFSKGEEVKPEDGWKTVGGKRYYNKNGKPLVGWHYVKYNGRTYYYYFDKDGAQVQDLYTHFGSSYKKKKVMLRVNRYHHTTDFLIYNPATKKYDIPAKSVVTSTPTESRHFPTGTYKLSYTRRWWSFVTTNSKGVKSTGYYQYATRVAGSPASLIHSSRYSAQKASALVVGNYNKLGTNQSYYCIRMQCVNSKLAYDLARTQGSGKVKCVFTNEKTLGPNGKVTLANTTGKVKKGTKYDPTDPNRK